MENKFKLDSEFEKECKDFMNEYEEARHMLPNKILNSFKQEYFLPHHAVQKKYRITTKLRVVFDGSYDQNLQKIMWRNSSDSAIKEYRFSTVTYGTSSALFSATRCLHQIGLDFQNINPEISNIIQHSFYMDDLMAGAKSNKEAIALIQNLSETLDAKGFHIRKWRSNSQDILNILAQNLGAKASKVKIHPENCSKTLGLIWDSSTDCFAFKINFNFESEIIKISFLSQSARPSVVCGKATDDQKEICGKIRKYDPHCSTLIDFCSDWKRTGTGKGNTLTVIKLLLTANWFKPN
ncbi:DUF1758 domain-containing protein [Nephila pilipes]|uniref:DUF1758 domain-containing protein n=1 Tax=Nephila pilipes TaxID=299642 RepID=A0A8X6PVH5_NEPPI|nr:DUF1758 domain-containing protein [Nephila pilipes]